jgi:hypothetical protein
MVGAAKACRLCSAGVPLVGSFLKECPWDGVIAVEKESVGFGVCAERKLLPLWWLTGWCLGVSKEELSGKVTESSEMVDSKRE